MNCSFVGMNYLGHAYLSFNSPEVLVGNMISDFVKGASKFRFSGNIQKGIALHREIDAFTDCHPATKKAMEVFRPGYRLYSGPIMDILYDHFIATDTSLFDDATLRDFTTATYRHLEQNTVHLPNIFLQVLTYMQADDWLYNYKNKGGIQRSLYGLARRATYIKESETAFNLFTEHYDYLKDCYSAFFTDVKLFAKQKFEELVL
jgi:acyl carrier protein phosphodiesterase